MGRSGATQVSSGFSYVASNQRPGAAGYSLTEPTPNTCKNHIEKSATYYGTEQVM